MLCSSDLCDSNAGNFVSIGAVFIELYSISFKFSMTVMITPHVFNFVFSYKNLYCHVCLICVITMHVILYKSEQYLLSYIWFTIPDTKDVIEVLACHIYILCLHCFWIHESGYNRLLGKLHLIGWVHQGKYLLCYRCYEALYSTTYKGRMSI